MSPRLPGGRRRRGRSRRTRPGEDSAPRAGFSKIPSRDSGPGPRLNPQGESGPSVLRAQEGLFCDGKFPVEVAGWGSEAVYCSVRLRTMTGTARPGGFLGSGGAPQPKVPARLPPRRCCTCSSVVAESLPQTRQLRAGQGHCLTLVMTPRVLPGALTDLPDQGPQPSRKGTEAHGFTEQAVIGMHHHEGRLPRGETGAPRLPIAD